MREITTNEHGMAAGVVYYDAEGIERFQAAEGLREFFYIVKEVRLKGTGPKS